jgi:hypothetical protein
MKLILPWLALFASFPTVTNAQTANLVFLDCNLQKDQNVKHSIPPKLSMKIDLKTRYIFIFDNGRYQNACDGKGEDCSIYEDAFVMLKKERNIEENIENVFRISVSRYSGKIDGTTRTYTIKGMYGPRSLKNSTKIFSGICTRGVDLAPRKF